MTDEHLSDAFTAEKKMQVAFRLDAGLIDAIDELADQQMRSRSNMVEYILSTYFRARTLGKLPSFIEPWESPE